MIKKLIYVATLIFFIYFIDFIICNCYRIDNKATIRAVKNMVQCHKSIFLVLMETKLYEQRVEKQCRKLGFSYWYKVEIQGRNGGIWMFLRSQEIKATINNDNFQFLHVEEQRDFNPRWLLLQYMLTAKNVQRDFWLKLENFIVSITTYWLMVGHFNSIIALSETTSVSNFTFKRFAQFASWINKMGLIDLGFSSTPFIWSRGLTAIIRISSRLNRALCNIDWRHLFLEAYVKHLSKY